MDYFWYFLSLLYIVIYTSCYEKNMFEQTLLKSTYNNVKVNSNCMYCA